MIKTREITPQAISRNRLTRSGPMSAAETQTPQQRPSQQLLGIVRDWVEREITFVDHPQFRKRNATRTFTCQRPASLDQRQPLQKLEPGLAFVAGMVEMPLLSLEEEQHLFAWMNFLKYRAERSRKKLSLNHPDELLVKKIDSYLLEATSVRNDIVRSNLRLVVSLAKKLSAMKQAGALDQMSELISEGTLPLIRAVELFDVSLGNRFSTYATWAVRNQMFRFLKRRRSLVESPGGEGDHWMNRVVDNRAYPENDQRQSAQRAQLVETLLTQLSQRERMIVAARFGLCGHPRGQSLNEIANQVGLSKERIRQIVIASLEKLHDVAQVGFLKVGEID